MSDARDHASAILAALGDGLRRSPRGGTAGAAMRGAGAVASLVARLVEQYGTETAEEMLRALVKDPPERVDLDAMDAALARWKAAQEI